MCTWRCSDCSRSQNKYRENSFLKKNANVSTRQISQLYSTACFPRILQKGSLSTGCLYRQVFSNRCHRILISYHDLERYISTRESTKRNTFSRPRALVARVSCNWCTDLKIKITFTFFNNGTTNYQSWCCCCGCCWYYYYNNYYY